MKKYVWSFVFVSLIGVGWVVWFGTKLDPAPSYATKFKVGDRVDVFYYENKKIVVIKTDPECGRYKVKLVSKRSGEFLEEWFMWYELDHHVAEKKNAD